MRGTLGRFAPREVVNGFVEEIKKEASLWNLIMDRELERKQFTELAKAMGKRADLEPEAFPPPKRPTSVEAISEFLERRYIQRDKGLAAQIALTAGEHARRELGL